MGLSPLIGLAGLVETISGSVSGWSDPIDPGRLSALALSGGFGMTSGASST